MKVIEVRDLVKKYGNFTAVNSISFEVYEGELFGFLGPNGAGKSTTINMLSTLSRPTSGHATVNGYDVVREPDAVRQSLGLIFQDPSLDERLTGWENMRFHALLYNVPGPVFEQRAEELLEMVELTDKARALVRTYSGGMRRRLEIARGLLHHPAVLFLDEPTLGLDPQTRLHIWEYLINLRSQEGLTMFLTTHYMEEAENADRIAIIDHGDIIALDTPAGLKSLVGGDIIGVRTENNALAAAKLAEAYGVEPRTGPEGQLLIETVHGDQFIPQIVSTLANSETPVPVQSIDLRRPTLEDVFIKLTGRAIREEEANARDQMRGHLGRRR